jgi:hypothetical protein
VASANLSGEESIDDNNHRFREFETTYIQVEIPQNIVRSRPQAVPSGAPAYSFKAATGNRRYSVVRVMRICLHWYQGRSTTILYVYQSAFLNLLLRFIIADVASHHIYYMSWGMYYHYVGPCTIKNPLDSWTYSTLTATALRAVMGEIDLERPISDFTCWRMTWIRRDLSMGPVLVRLTRIWPPRCLGTRLLTPCSSRWW